MYAGIIRYKEEEKRLVLKKEHVIGLSLGFAFIVLLLHIIL